MRERLVGVLLAAAVPIIDACSEQREAATTTDPPSSEGRPAVVPSSAPPSTAPVTSAPATTAAATTTAAPTTTSTTTTTTVVAASTSTTTATTVAAPVPPVEPAAICVVEIRPGDSLSLIVATIASEAVSVASLQAENALADPNTINAGDVLDICVGNDIDDVTGQPRVPPTTAPVPAVVAVASGTGVAAQQQKLNELFAGYGLPALAVDGVSGRLTRQQLCAARAALGLPISRADMEPGGADEQALMAAASLAIPTGAPASAARWALIDKTCQIMFVGERDARIVYVFQTSTGEAGYETRNQNGSRAFRYDPARASNGWHNSIDYPVPGDNPLNGNMYLPVYFDGGQAIHGANNVPPEPRSKGCARLRVDSQAALVDWLGLSGAGGPIWNDPGRIDLSVSVQGRF